MKRRSSLGEVNNNSGDSSLPASKKSKLKVDKESIETLMRDAGRAESRGAATLLYEKVGKIAESLKEAAYARKIFLDIGLKFAILALKEVMNNPKLDCFKKSMINCGKAVQRCHNLLPGPTARVVQTSVFDLLDQAVSFVQSFDDGKQRNICLEQIIRALGLSGDHWLELVILAKARIIQAELLNDAAAVAIADKKFKDGIYLLSEMYRPMELASEFTAKIITEGHDKVAVVRQIVSDIADIRIDYRTHMAMAHALQSLFMAGEMINDAILNSEEMSVDFVWGALDLLKQAAITSGDVEVEANARGKMGLVYFKILKMEDIAKTYIRESMDLTKTMSSNLYTFSWYAEVAKVWQELQEEVVRREEDLWAKEREPLLQDKEVKRSLKLLETKRIDDIKEYAEFLFDYFEPEHLKRKVTYEEFKTEAESKGLFDSSKKLLQKLITHWHPDKVSKDSEEDKKWYIVCEEITKKLTAKYTEFKC